MITLENETYPGANFEFSSNATAVLKWATFYVILPVVLPSGFIGNVISFIILKRKSHENKAFLYQVAVVVTDAVTVIFLAGYYTGKLLGTREIDEESIKYRRIYLPTYVLLSTAYDRPPKHVSYSRFAVPGLLKCRSFLWFAPPVSLLDLEPQETGHSYADTVHRGRHLDLPMRYSPL